MSRIIRPTAYGKPHVLDVFEVPIPEPAVDGVVVQVRAAGVNPIDWKLYSGTFHAVADKHRDAAGVDPESMPKLGLECAGVVTAVGSQVDDVHVGAEVIVYPVTSAYSDYVTVPKTSLIPKPAALSWAEAAALMLAGTTATHALHAAGVQSGDTLLIHGGSGGVGLMAVQLATALGASVIATASEHNHELLRSLGVTPVSYGPGLLDRIRTAAPSGISTAVDFAGSDEALDTSVELVADRQRIASITGSGRRVEAGIKVLGNAPGQELGAEIRNAARTSLADQAGAGSLRVFIDQTYPLDQAAKAHEAGMAGHAAGKLVLIP